jgi:hypothetical protein
VCSSVFLASTVLPPRLPRSAVRWEFSNVELVHQDAASSSHGGGLVKATLSCDDGADLFADVKNALRPLRLNVIGCEVTTLGGRVRFTFLLSPAACGQDAIVVQQALQSVIDKANSALEFAPRASLLNKRRRVSTFEYSSSSSCDTFNQPSRVSYYSKVCMDTTLFAQHYISTVRYKTQGQYCFGLQCMPRIFVALMHDLTAGEWFRNVQIISIHFIIVLSLCFNLH